MNKDRKWFKGSRNRGIIDLYFKYDKSESKITSKNESFIKFINKNKSKDRFAS